jgi:hypothetical protein
MHLLLCNESSRGEIEYQTAIHFRVKTKVKIVECVVRVADQYCAASRSSGPSSTPSGIPRSWLVRF